MRLNVLQIRIGQMACFVICLLLMLVIPIVHDNKIIGISLDKTDGEEAPATMVELPSGETVVNTTTIGKDIIGYVGATPVEITIKEGKIEKVKPLDNKETPEFFGSVVNSDLFDSLEGLTLEEASKKQLDGVSGATYTSNALIKNIKAGVAYAMDENNTAVHEDAPQPVTAKFYFSLAVILMGAVIPLFLRHKGYRIVQLILNVAILGFWGGTFLSYSIMLSMLTNGITRVVLIPVALMLVVAFIYPMFGKVNHYCSWICPYGSIQELAGKLTPRKINISPKAAKILSTFRDILWFALMWLLWTGLWFDWMGYEPFAAFFILDASVVVLSIAGAFILLSLFVQRPYCRFVCPTGTLFKLSEGRK